MSLEDIEDRWKWVLTNERWANFIRVDFPKLLAVAKAAKLLFDYCENELGMDKPELTCVRAALAALEKEE